MLNVALTPLLLSAASASAATRYVWQSSPSPAPPYTNWTSAAHVIQDAVDVALSGDEIVVTNGTYATGGRAVGTNVLVNRVAVDKPLTVRSVKGAQFTLIQGYQIPGSTNGDGAIRCAYLTNGASLNGFTLTNGATRWVNYDPTFAELSGGGVWCESWNAMISNCVVSGNSATDFGGGAYRGTFYNCRLEGNVANGQGYGGGGADSATLYNCTLAGNRASVGGGAYSCSLYNCIVINNSARSWGGGGALCNFYNCTVTVNSSVNSGGGVGESWLFNSIVYYNSATSGEPDSDASSAKNSCTTGFRAYQSANNITNPPLFAANLRLRSDSPCINAGDNAFAGGPRDFGGNPRIVNGTVDIGAYEFQGAGSLISYAWLQQYGWPTDGSADALDPDSDRMNNWQEWRCLTDPTNALSALRLLSPSRAGTNVTVSWQSVAGVNYFLERSTNLSVLPLFTPLAASLPGQPGTTSFTDINAALRSPLFYRVGVLP